MLTLGHDVAVAHINSQSKFQHKWGKAPKGPPKMEALLTAGGC